MTDYTLSKEKIAELEKLHRSLRDKRQADRVKAAIDLFGKLQAKHYDADIIYVITDNARYYRSVFQVKFRPQVCQHDYYRTNLGPLLETNIDRTP
jgi:hypothetical protein